MPKRFTAPETLPRCPICEKRILCLNNNELSIHVDKCFEKSIAACIKSHNYTL